MTQEQREAASKIAGRFMLRPGHDWDDIHVKSLLISMATQILDEEDADDGFAIVTKNGLRITRNSVTVKESVDVEGNRRIIDGRQMFDALERTFANFVEIGVIDDDEVPDDG